MRHRTFAVALALVVVPALSARAQVLQLGLDDVGWEARAATETDPAVTLDSGALLFREVPEAELVSVRAKISAQTAGFWSQAGVIARVPNPIDMAPAQEDWQAAWSFRGNAPNGPFELQHNVSTAGTETEAGDGGLGAEELMYVRLDNLGEGIFQAYRGSGTDDNIVWTPQMDGEMMPQTLTNANLVGATLQVGVTGGALDVLAGSSTIFDWVEIVTDADTFRDDFDYVHDFSSGVPVGGIWDGIENAGAGGAATATGDLGRCLECVWDVNGSGNFNTAANWVGADEAVPLITPNRNDTSVLFGDAAMGPAATVYTNENATVKGLEFNSTTSTYVLGGAGSITLDADTGDAVIDVVAGSHQIQADLILADNVTATAAAGATLNINASIVLNGNTFTTAGAGVVNMNNGTIATGSGALVNEGNLAGLGGVEGAFAQSAAGSLAVTVGESPVIDVEGDAELGGVLNVSLADGFVPVAGASYPVLTADSVTNNGLTLGGEAAKLFALEVGGGSVSLSVIAIPEPAGLLLAAAGLAAAVCGRRRRRAGGTASRGVGLSISVCTLIAMLVLPPAVADAQPLAPGFTYRDDFDTFFDYRDANGGVPSDTLQIVGGGGTASWAAAHNAQNGGDEFFPAVFEANGITDNNTMMPAPGQLSIEDIGIHVNNPDDPEAPLGVGFEAGGEDWNNAPFLYAEVDAGNNFEMTVKIDNQVAGQWSYAGVITRLHGPPVGINRDLDDETNFDSDEAFVTVGRFATDPAAPDASSILIQNINDFDGDGVVTEQEVDSGLGGVGAAPLWLRVTKEASQFTVSTSADGVEYTEGNSWVNSSLNTPGEVLEVGPSFMLFGGAAGFGAAQYDFFEITVSEQLVFEDATWAPGGLGSGNWNDGENWGSMTGPGQVPSANTVNVLLGDANADGGPSTVYNNSDITIRSLTFDSSNKYAVSGAGSITLEPYELHVNPDETFVHVDTGSHEIQVAFALSAAAANDNHITAQAGARLDINNSFNLNGKTLIVDGDGQVNLNNNIDTGTGGTVIVSEGNLGGSGRVNGNLRNGDASNPGGVLSPGLSVGTMTVDGVFAQAATGTLEIELGGAGAGEHDVLHVVSVATLNGLLDVAYANDFFPTEGDVGTTWDIVTSELSVNDVGLELHPSDAPYYSLTFESDLLRLTLDEAPPPIGDLTGDYNADGVVDSRDYVVWRDTLGTAFELPNRDPGSSGNVNADDYDAWVANYGAASGAADGAGAVPEPTAMAGLLLAAVIASARRRRARPDGC